MGMLAENIRQWAVDYKEAGLAQGLEKGRTEGLEEGNRKRKKERVSRGLTRLDLG